MATQTYRYRRTNPVDIARLKAEVGTNTTVIAADGGHVVDVQIEDTAEDLGDLDESMLLMGYVRISDNPALPPADDFSPTSGAGGGGGGFNAEYRFSTTTTAADPGNGRARFNDAVYASITEVYFDDTADNPTFDMGLVFSTMNPGDRLVVQQNSDITRSVVFTIDNVTDNGGWWTFGVTYLDDGGGPLIQNNAPTTFGFLPEGDHIRHNLTATTDPDNNDDVGDGYEPGSTWINNTSDKAFICVDATATLAIWSSTTSGGFVGGTTPADKFQNPLSADWAVNGLAPLADDTNDDGLSVRLFDDTTEEGVGLEIVVPLGATNMQLFTMARAETTPGGSVVAKLLFYEREIANGAAVTAWSSSIALTDVDLSTNEFFVEDETDKTLAAWGLTAGKTHQIQITRTSVSDTLSGDLAFKSLRREFT